MDLDLPQLRALRAAVDAGTLEGAARTLHVTPSAVSQRLKALEQATGRVLLVRSRPVRVTEPGRAVLRLARELDLLATGSSDYHGTGKVDHDLGVNTTDPSVFAEISARMAARVA